MVVLEGTGHTAVGSVVDLNNAQVREAFLAGVRSDPRGCCPLLDGQQQGVGRLAFETERCRALEATFLVSRTWYTYSR